MCSGLCCTMYVVYLCEVDRPLPHSRVAPATPERQAQLDEERKLLAEMRPHKRKLYLLQRQKVQRSWGGVCELKACTSLAMQGRGLLTSSVSLDYDSARISSVYRLLISTLMLDIIMQHFIQGPWIVSSN